MEDAESEHLVAKAGLDRARLDMEATRITSPIDGQTGGTVCGIGNRATPNTTLVTIVASDPIFIEFFIGENFVGPVRKLFQHPPPTTAEVKLPGDTGFEHRAEVVFVDNRVNAANGAVRVRASLPNPDGQILPGMAVKVRLPVAESREEFLIPATALKTTTSHENFVLLAGPGNVLEWRRVEIARIAPDGRIAIEAGLKADDRVILNRFLPAPGLPIHVSDSKPEK
jgi:RND family efflux transporter MFP subunit